jgi:hypothetical protein
VCFWVFLFLSKDENKETADAALKELIDAENAHRGVGEGEIEGERKPHAVYDRYCSAEFSGTEDQLAEMQKDLFFTCVCADGCAKAHSAQATANDVTRKFTAAFSHDIRDISCQVTLLACELDAVGKAAAEWTQTQLKEGNGTLVMTKEHGTISVLRTLRNPDGILIKVRDQVVGALAIERAAAANEAL